MQKSKDAFRFCVNNLGGFVVSLYKEEKFFLDK